MPSKRLRENVLADVKIQTANVLMCSSQIYDETHIRRPLQYTHGADDVDALCFRNPSSAQFVDEQWSFDFNCKTNRRAFP